MSLTAAVLILAQSALPQTASQAAVAPQAGGAPQPGTAPMRASRGVSVQVQASARIVRPARVTFDTQGTTRLHVTGAQMAQVQSSRDANGTLWAEFN